MTATYGKIRNPNAPGAIRQLSRDEFDEHKPSRGPLSALTGEEREWYADDRDIVIGVLVLDKIDNDWSYIILGRDRRKKFREIDVQVSIRDKTKAREKLMNSLERLAKSGKSVFPQ